MTSSQERLQQIYVSFNARDMEAAVAAMKPDVQWANSMEGGYVYGRDAVRDYWAKQFTQVQPQLKIFRFETDDAGRTLVTVHQVVRDLEGRLIVEQEVGHRFSFEDDLVALFEIVDSTP